MGISSIGSLFASKFEPALRQQESSAKQDSRSQSSQRTAQSADTSAASSDAVVFTRSSSSTAATAPASDSQRKSQVQELRSQIDTKSYAVDSAKVAVAVLKDLA